MICPLTGRGFTAKGTATVALIEIHDGWAVARGTSPEFPCDQIEITARQPASADQTYRASLFLLSP